MAVLLYNNDWAKKSPRAASEFMVAYVKASRDMLDAIAGGKSRPEIVEILTKHTRVKDKALYDRMHKDSPRDQQEWYVKAGLVPKKIDVDGMVDDRYVRYAIEKLGVHR